MMALFARLRTPYRSSIPPVVQPWIDPGRHALLSFRHRWPPIRMAVVCVILVLAAWPLVNSWRRVVALCLIIGVYLVWQLAFHFIEQHPRFADNRWQHMASIIWYLGGVVALFVLTSAVPSLAAHGWVLYLAPVLTIGVCLERWSAFGLILLTTGLAFISAIQAGANSLTQSSLEAYVREGLIRAAIIGYVGFTTYLLARCLAYQHRSSRRAIHQLLNITAMTSWTVTANKIAEIISDQFSDVGNPVIANILLYDRASDQLSVAGSSDQHGKHLAETHFCFPASKGITGWAARYGQPCFINDLHCDPEGRYLAERAFALTRSALAAPVALDGDHTAVLEVESPRPVDFAQEDLQLLEMIGSHLVVSHRRNQLLEFHRQLAELGQDLAERIIQVEEIGQILDRIGSVALRLLEADVIGFYYRHPATGKILKRRTVGNLFFPSIEGSPINDGDNPVVRLMEVRQPNFYTEAQNDPTLTTIRPWHRNHLTDPFVLRERIVSCAAIPLVVGKECNGAMWVNYRRSVSFEAPLRHVIQLIAPYAALAIQSGLQSNLVEQQRRKELQRIAHDSLSHRLRDISRGFDKLSGCQPKSTTWFEEIVIVRAQLERAKRVTDNLAGERPWWTLRSLVDDLCSHAQLIERTYGIAVQVAVCAMPEMAISPDAANEFMFACDEILGNITRHAEATSIEIRVNIVERVLIVAIKDNGIGFNVQQLRPGQGLSSIRARAEALAGAVQIQSEPCRGTTITLTIPLPGNENGGQH
jgi:signal transduction histidine kinase